MNIALTAIFPTGINETSVNDPQWQGTLRAENTLAQRHNPCDIRTTGFHVQDERYAAGAGSAGAAISRLVSLIPKPRVNLTRFHGVFAPNSKHRAEVTPAKRGRGKKTKMANDKQDQTPAERRAAMTWAQRLKRVFNIDIETCAECGGDVKIIACIEDPAVIQKILAHLDGNETSAATGLLPERRAPPATGLFD